MAVRTACGQSTETRTPRAPYAMARYSAKATAACLVAAYVADSTWVRRPAAEAVLTRYPLPRAAIFGATARAAYTWAMTCRSQFSRHSSSGASSPPRQAIPALEQNTSIGPKRFSAAAARACTARSSVTSHGTARPSISLATDSSWSDWMSATATPFAPSRANRRARARPIPLAAPVTTTTLPSIFKPLLPKFVPARRASRPTDIGASGFERNDPPVSRGPGTGSVRAGGTPRICRRPVFERSRSSLRSASHPRWRGATPAPPARGSIPRSRGRSRSSRCRRVRAGTPPE